MNSSLEFFLKESTFYFNGICYSCNPMFIFMTTFSPPKDWQPSFHKLVPVTESGG